MSDEKDPQDDTTAESGEPTSHARTDEREGAPRDRPRRAKTGSSKSRAGRAEPAPSPSPVGMFAVIGLAAAAIGAAGGWFGHEAQAKAKLRADSAPAASGSAAPSGPCGAWQQKICASSGDNSATCGQAKSAVDLLTPSTCTAALESVPATLAKVKLSRAACDSLVSKLCADLPPGSSTCTMVRERTPEFPHERCEGMLSHYDEVLGELRQLDQRGGPPAMGAPPGGPGGPGAAAPGGPGAAAPGGPGSNP